MFKAKSHVQNFKTNQNVAALHGMVFAAARHGGIALGGHKKFTKNAWEKRCHVAEKRCADSSEKKGKPWGKIWKNDLMISYGFESVDFDCLRRHFRFESLFEEELFDLQILATRWCTSTVQSKD